MKERIQQFLRPVRGSRTGRVFRDQAELAWIEGNIEAHAECCSRGSYAMSAI